MRARQLLVGLVAVVALMAPVLGLGFFVHATIASDVATRSAGDRVHDALLASQLLSTDVMQAGQAAQYLASRTAVRDALRAGDATALGSELAAFEASTPEYAAIVGLDGHGRELAIGTPTGPTIRGGAGADRSARDYFTGALGTSAPFVSDAYQPNTPGISSLVAVSFAVREGGTILGVVVVTLTPGQVIDDVAKAAAQSGRVILVVDKTSHVVASTSDRIPALSSVRVPELGAAAAGARGSTQAPLPMGERVVTYVPVAGSPWVLYIVDDPSVVLAVEHDLQDRLSIAASAALLATLLLAAGMITLFVRLSHRSEQLGRSRAALVASNQQLEEANRHKSEFLSSVSHELRTPMNAILGFTDLLDEQLRSSITERQQRYFRNVREAGDHLLDLINDVLDLSRVDSGRIDLRPEDLTLERLLEPVIAYARRSAIDGGIEFAATAPDGPIRVDAERVRQVLYNLLSNALKFTHRGGRVEMEARFAGQDLAIDVRDNGIGIPADRHERVFGMFERVNEDRSRAKGTGLGLALSKRIVELHGGAIGFTSVADKGSTFWIRLPRVARSAPTEGRSAAVARTAG